MKPKQTPSYSVEEEIRTRLNDRLGRRPVSESEWNDLVEQGFVDDVALAGLPFDESVIELAVRVSSDRLRDRLRAELDAKFARQAETGDEQPKRKRKRKREKPAPGWLCEAAAAVILAAEVAEYPGVQGFRADVLGGRLLDEDHLVEWLQQRAREEIFPDLWLTNSVVPVGHGEAVLAALEKRYGDLPRDERGDPLPLSITITLDPRRIWQQVSPRYLRCTVRDPGTKQRYVHQCPTSVDGTLEWLRGYGEALAALCSWSEPEAVRFILTGITPHLPRIRHSTRFSHETVRVQITVDPAATPDDVKEYYQRVRKPMISRTRTHDAKHMVLALFTEQDPRREREPWREYLRRWNQTWGADHPGWVYSADQDVHFARDCRHVREHVRWLDCKVPIPRWLPQMCEELELEPGTEGGLLTEVGGDSKTENAYVWMHHYGRAAREMIRYAPPTHEGEDPDEQGRELGEASTHGEARQ